MREVTRIARREVAAFFGSPVAYIFLATFLAVTLFVFFWVERFFARNIADLRPLFEWMPVLLIFLVAAITMRTWSEERRSGTLEVLMTAPVSSLQLVAGKFLACMALVVTALLLTLPLPVTVALLGPLDPGPVAGGYLATVLLAAAYTSVGLYVSSRTDNQIVSLMGTVLACSVLYMVGSDALTGLFGQRIADLLALLGTGSRFESITRGVLDLRDLYYYLSIVGVFMTLNVYSLERLRWSGSGAGRGRHRQLRLAVLLFVANFVVGNLWLQPVAWVRADITEGNLYSISDTTRTYLASLEEPLVIRGYFSSRTHPLLAPLVPQLADLLREYAVAGGRQVRVEIVDPQSDPDIEREAAEQYGIESVPFRTESKYQSSVVNSYFNVLVSYGSEHEVLGLQDLIEVKQQGAGDVDVRLRNPEYAITRSIRRVVYAYRGGGDVFAGLDEPVTLHAFVSASERLPQRLARLREELDTVVDDLKQQAGDRLSVHIADPQAGDGELAGEIREKYGFRPMVTGLLDDNRFYFYLALEQGGRTVPVPLPEKLDAAALQQAIEDGVKRFSGDVLRTVALYAPSPRRGPYGVTGAGYSMLADQLRENAALVRTDLSSGRVPQGADLLLVVAPWELDERQVFAIDQFLMRGGTVVIAASPFDVRLDQGGLTARKRKTGLEDWLQAKGLTIEEELVLDPRNAPFPIPVERDVGGFRVREVHDIDYPYFVDVREDGMADGTAITAGLGQVTVAWPSPVTFDEDAVDGYTVRRLLQSSARSWTSAETGVTPRVTAAGVSAFEPRGERGRRVLATVVEGRFDSWFRDRDSPLQGEAGTAADGEAAQGTDAPQQDEEQQPPIAGLIARSPASARLVLFASSSLLDDTTLQLVASGQQARYTRPVELVQNTVDWALEDPALLALRGNSHFSRLLLPLSESAQRFWEYLNYGLALLGLLVFHLVQRLLRRRRERHYLSVLEDGRSPA